MTKKTKGLNGPKGLLAAILVQAKHDLEWGTPEQKLSAMSYLNDSRTLALIDLAGFDYVTRNLEEYTCADAAAIIIPEIRQCPSGQLTAFLEKRALLGRFAMHVARNANCEILQTFPDTYVTTVRRFKAQCDYHLLAEVEKHWEEYSLAS